jgi:uncharacterized caspase-like protein
LAKNDRHYAIAIGIDTYPSLRRLTASVRDATAFCEWLLSADGGNLPEQNLKFIPSLPKMPGDRFDARPIRLEIDRALRDFGVEQNRRLGDRLYFYFAGHGFGPSFDNVGMLMANAAMGALTENIGLRPFRDYFYETKRFDEVVFLLDCCRDREFKDDTMPPGFDKKLVAQDGKPVVDFVVMASSYGEKAFAPVERETNERRGLLTKALLEGLRGAPRAVDAEGRITATSLSQYLKERVPALAKIEKLVQDAECPPPTAEIVFRTLDPATLKRVRVHIVVPAEVGGEFVLRDGGRREVGRRNAEQARADNPWTEDLLVNSRYELEHVDSDIAVIIDPAKAKEEPYVFTFPRP